MKRSPVVGAFVALSLLSPRVCATDFRTNYHDRVIPAPPSRPPPHVPSQEELDAQSRLLREDLVSWHAEVFAPLAFTNRTCVRMRQTFMTKHAGKVIMREDMAELQRRILSVRQSMLERARAFVPRTANVREVNNLLCRTLDLHVSWMERVTRQHFDVTVCPAPPELVASKRAFTEAFAPYRQLVAPVRDCDGGSDDVRDD